MYVYVMGSVNGPQKIGIAADPLGRLSQLRTGHPFPLTIHSEFQVSSEAEARTIERQAHKALSEKRLQGEWFEVNPSAAIQAVEEAIIAIQQGEVAVQSAAITPAQIRAARALIGWKQSDLAKASGVSEISIKNIERSATDARSSTLSAIQSAFSEAGVVFLDSGDTRDGGQGVRMRRPA